MRITAEREPSPKRMRTSGTQAVTGIGLRTPRVGSIIAASRFPRPSKMPRGTATAVAAANPANTRPALAQRWVRNVAL